MIRVPEVKKPFTPYNHKTYRKVRRIIKDGHTTRGKSRTDRAVDEYELARAEFRTMD